MKIRDMFYKGIDREINGVIKVGQKDKENVYQELDEYVVTGWVSGSPVSLEVVNLIF